MFSSSLTEPLFNKKSEKKYTTANVDFKSPITVRNGVINLIMSFIILVIFMCIDAKWFYKPPFNILFLNDPTIILSYEGKASTAVSVLRCIAFTVILPLISFEVICYKIGSDWSEINHCMFSVSTQYLSGYAFSCFISSFINSLGGSFSPDYIDRCDPVENITMRVTDISDCNRDPTDGLTYVVINEVVVSTYSLLFLCRYLSVYLEKQYNNNSVVQFVYMIILCYCYGIGMIRVHQHHFRIENNCGSMFIGLIIYYIMIKNVIYYKSQFSEIKESLRKYSTNQRSRSSDGQSLAIIAPLLSDEKEEEEEEEEETAL